MRNVLLTILFACALLCIPAVGSAQVVLNPTQVQFDDAGYATVTNYQVAYHFLTVTAGVCDAVTTASPTATYTDTVPKPTTSTGIGMTASLTTKPVGCYALKIRKLDQSGLYSPWSALSTNAGEKDPTAPTNTVVK